jgi:hypothetical protein
VKRSLFEKYQLGMITDNELIVGCLNTVDPEHPEQALSSLPENILLRVFRFTKECGGRRLISNFGEIPSQDQILAAQHWIEKTIQQKPNVLA